MDPFDASANGSIWIGAELAPGTGHEPEGCVQCCLKQAISSMGQNAGVRREMRWPAGGAIRKEVMRQIFVLFDGNSALSGNRFLATR